MAVDTLPSSFARASRGEKVINGLLCRMAYCANCGTPDSWFPVAAEHLPHFCLCNACVDKWGVPAAAMEIMTQPLWEKIKQAQLEAEGRELTPAEWQRALDDPSHYLSKLAREAPKPER